MADVGEIKARLTMNSTDFKKKMDEAKGEMTSLSKSAQRTSEDLKGIQGASLALGTAVGAAIAASVGVAANFEQKLADVKAISGATADEMQQLSQLAKDLGESTSFSASEAAAGIEELLRSGLSVEQVIGGGLKGALDLAAAGGIELGKAAEIASIALNAFKDDQMSVTDAANILAGAANASATDVLEMQYGLSAVSAVAAGVGMTFQDTSTALAIFAQNGLKGSDAGTSLKTMLQNLQPTTKEQIALFKELGLMSADGANAFFDLNGQLKEIDDIAGILQKSMQGMTDQQRAMALEVIFGADAVRAGNILYREGAEGINEMWDAMSNVTAAEVAATKMDTLKGAVEEFKGAIETIGIEVGEDFLPALTNITRKVTEVIRSFDEVDLANGKSALAFAGTAAAIAGVLATVGRLGSAFLAFSMTPVGAVISGLALLGGAVAAAITYSNDMKEVTLDNANAMLTEADSLKESIAQYDDLRAKSQLTTDELARFLDINSEIASTADPEAIARLKEEQDGLREKSGLTNAEFQTMLDLNGKIIDVVPEAASKITEQGNALAENTQKAKEYNAQQYEMIRLELEAQQAKAEANMADYLEDEVRLMQQINDLKAGQGDLDRAEIDQRTLVGQIEADLAEAKRNNDTLEQERLTRTLEMHQKKLDGMKDQRAANAELIVEKSKELEKIQEQIGKLDEVKRKMVDLELKQAGLNSKRGEELKTIDNAIGKLEAQKKKLAEITPAAQKNSDEYRESVAAIDRQIGELNTVKSRIAEIIGQASKMNAELSKEINKYIYETRVQRVISTGTPQAGGQQEVRHTGGVIGSSIPKLHVGGQVSNLLNAPNHNEIDVRAMRGELMLTEAQQANLFRMIDAGFAGTANAQPSQPAVVHQTNYIEVAGNIDTELYDNIMRRQGDEYTTLLLTKGLKER